MPLGFLYDVDLHISSCRSNDTSFISQPDSMFGIRAFHSAMIKILNSSLEFSTVKIAWTDLYVLTSSLLFDIRFLILILQRFEFHLTASFFV